MAGSSMTFTQDTRGCLRRLICSFVTDDATGAASGTTPKICGRLVKVVTDPGATAPTDNWDVAVTDENGLDPLALCNAGAVSALIARDTANTEETYLYLATAVGLYPVVCGPLTVAVANGGNSKNGTITFYYENLE